MKEELRWLNIWIGMNTMMLAMSMSYFYLSHELSSYGSNLVLAYVCAIVIPYGIWKYKKLKSVKKATIIIQILND